MFWIIFFRQLLLLTYFVPITVLVSLELIRPMQLLYISRDLQMIHELDDGDLLY